jgi:peptide/nickel transport system permease protein
MNLLQTIARRVFSILITLFGASVIVFVILRVLPGNAVTASLGTSEGLLTKAQVAALDQYYGVGQPALQQYFSWLHAVLSGNLGVSLTYRQPVSYMLGNTLPITLELSFFAIVLGIVIGAGLGLWSGLHPGRWPDALGQSVSVLGLSVPALVIGEVLVTWFSRQFHYFPSSANSVGFFTDPWVNFQQIIFPAFVLSLGIAAAILRTTRGAVLEVTSLNFARTALGKGVNRRSFVWRHIFLNSLTAVVTMSGIQLGYLLGGTVIVENIYVLNGMGRLMITSILNKDFPVVQSITLVFAAGFVIVNMLVDVLNAVIDPRIRKRGA